MATAMGDQRHPIGSWAREGFYFLCFQLSAPVVPISAPTSVPTGTPPQSGRVHYTMLRRRHYKLSIV